MKNISILKFINKEFFILIFLYLYFVNFLNFGTYFNLLIVLSAFYFLLKKARFLWDVNLNWLLAFLLLYSFFLEYNSFSMSLLQYIMFVATPISLYICGKYLISKFPYINIIYFLVFSLSFAFSIIPFVSNIFDTIDNGYMNNRDILMLWIPNIEFASTLVGAKFTLNMALIALVFVNGTYEFEDKLKKYAVILFVMGVFSLSNMSTRTGLFVTALTLIGVLLLMNLKQRFRYFLYFTIIVIIIYFVLDSFGLIDWFMESNYYYRLFEEIDETGKMPRVFRWGIGISGMFEFPLGGKKSVIDGFYMHNLWIDVGWKVGVLPLMALLVFTYKFIRIVIKIVYNKTNTLFFRATILCIAIGFIASFMVEPIIEGLFENFCLFCLFFGIFETIKNKPIVYNIQNNSSVIQNHM